jgi:hypothetical protein
VKNLLKKLQDEQNKINKKIKIFLQVNIGDEDQKSGINKSNIQPLASYCKRDWFGFNWFDVYSTCQILILRIILMR